jgi:bifunctional N-acetylglucosamine-1-phosphate-uridyltransferase/glucosamine-1-phosphate-acetyltransferase GlmU-like protein
VLAIVERPTIDVLDGQLLTFESLGGERHDYRRQQLLAVREVNLSTYVWTEGVLRAHIGKLAMHPEKGEYFVTDLVEIFREQRRLVRATSTSVEGEGIGIDTPELLRAAQQVQRRLEATALLGSREDGVDERVADEML